MRGNRYRSSGIARPYIAKARTQNYFGEAHDTGASVSPYRSRRTVALPGAYTVITVKLSYALSVAALDSGPASASMVS